MPLPLTSPPLWRKIQKQNLTQLSELCEVLELSQEQRQNLLSRPAFPLNLPLRLANKMKKGSLEDPLLLQFVPTEKERQTSPQFTQEPVEDQRFQKAPRLLHKYQGRALLVTTSACAMHCRYCFRQNFPYEKNATLFAKELQAIKEDPSIEEVILSGGDPLSLSNRVLKNLLDQLAGISHLKRVRFHTRFMVGIPERVDGGLLDILRPFPKQIFWVVHINHPKELDAEVIASLKEIQKLGIPTLNQSVLLKGVNDTLATMGELLNQLVNCGVQPYYLHQLDRVSGSQQFEVSDQEALQLIEELRKELSGYAIPALVREIPGQPHKSPLI